MPETGVSPMLAGSQLMPALPGLGQATFADDDFRMVTVTHASMGEAVFGVTPGYAEVWACLRTRLDDNMSSLCEAAEALVKDIAETHGLTHEIDYHEIFVASVNAPEAVGHLRTALDQEGVGELVEIGIARGRKVRKNLKVGICGEHGGDPASVAFCARAKLDYVSCSPFRVPIARLAAAQAVLGKSQATTA